MMKRENFVPMMEAGRKSVGSGAQTVGMGRETGYVGRRKASFKEYVELTCALLCLAMLTGALYFSDLDSNYVTAWRMTSAIRRVLGIHDPALDTRRLILVAEHDDAQRLIAKTTLEHYGYAVALADTGPQTVDTFRKSAARVALVLLDTAGPADSREKTMQQLKKIRPDVRILLCRASGQDPREKAGAIGSIEKPFSAVPLAEAVGKAVLSR